MLILPIKKQWLDMIIDGIKKEEYRSINSYYRSRFQNAVDENNDFICKFRNGYNSDSPSIIVKVRLSVNIGNPDWGAEPDKECFVLTILQIIDISSPNILESS